MWEDAFLTHFEIISRNLLCGLSKTPENFSHYSLCHSWDLKRNLRPPPAHCRSEAALPNLLRKSLMFIKANFFMHVTAGSGRPLLFDTYWGHRKKVKTLHPQRIPSQIHSLHTNVASVNVLLVVFSNMPFGLVHIDERELQICWTGGRKGEALDAGINTFSGTFQYFK